VAASVLVIGLSFTTSGAASIEGLPLTKAAPVHSGELDGASPDSCKSAQKAVRFYRAAYLGWRAKMGAGPVEGSRPEAGSCPRYLSRVLRAKAHAARVAYQKWHRAHVLRYRALYEKWRCIHEHEGAWNSNTGNGYWGGLQMDWGFQHTYGPEFIRRYGLADRWPVWAQLEAAERAFHGFAGYGGRGYSPWGTRGRCGV